MKYLQSRYRAAILAFMALLLIFLGLFDLALFSEIENTILRNARRQTERELALLGTFTREALLRNDYVTARQFLSQWTEEHGDIVAFRAVAPNGFVLVDYGRPRAEVYEVGFDHQVEYAGRPLVRLRMRKDFTPILEGLDRLKWQMGSRSVLLTLFLGIALWYTLRGLALVPLEREVAARRQTEEKFRSLLEGAPDAMALVEASGIISLVNAKMELLFGYPRPELVGRNIETLVSENQRGDYRQAAAGVLEFRGEAEGTSVEVQAVARDGREFPADISFSPLAAAEFRGLLIDIRDITGRKRMERALRDSEQRYRDLVEGTDNLITQVNGRGEFTFVNHQAGKIFGLAPEECLGRSAFDFIHPEDREMTRQALALWVEKKMASATIENRQVSRTGEVRDLLWTINLHYGRGGELLVINAIARDITGRKRAEEKIRRSYQFQSTLNEILRTSLEALPLERQLARALDLILAIPSLTLEAKGCIYLVEEDPQMLVMKVQRGFAPERLDQCARVPFGKCLCGQAALRSEVVYADCLSEIHEIGTDIFPHGHYCIPIHSGERFYGLINLVLKEKHRREPEEEQFLSSVANTLAGMVERYRTAADKEKLQGRLIESEKLSALGRMTTNVAHEIRNPLTAVGGLARRLDRRIPEEAAEKRYTRVIVAEALRLEKIMKRVDSYIFDLPLDKHAMNFNRVVEEALAGFREICSQQRIEVRTSFAELPPVEMDRGKAREALDNVIDNAVDAMPAGGTLTVETRREHRENRDYAVVRIADTGAGIDPENLDRLSEPFYTTKAVGKRHAVGLGLSITKKYMDRHHGLIEVKSRPGEGATFDLFFPLGATGDK